MKCMEKLKNPNIGKYVFFFQTLGEDISKKYEDIMDFKNVF